MKCEFLYDFGSPNAHLVWHVLPDLEARTGVTFEPVPVLLGGIFKATGNQAPWMAFAKVKGKLAYEQREIARFIERHNVPFQMNKHFPLNSILPMRAATVARGKDWERDFITAVNQGVWVESLKMDDPEVFADRMAQAGLPVDDIVAGVQDQVVKDALRTTTEAAVGRGVFGIPTFFVDGEMFFGKDSLSEVEHWIGKAAKVGIV